MIRAVIAIERRDLSAVVEDAVEKKIILRRVVRRAGKRQLFGIGSGILKEGNKPLPELFRRKGKGAVFYKGSHRLIVGVQNSSADCA